MNNSIRDKVLRPKHFVPSFLCSSMGGHRQLIIQLGILILIPLILSGTGFGEETSRPDSPLIQARVSRDLQRMANNSDRDKQIRVIVRLKNNIGKTFDRQIRKKAAADSIARLKKDARATQKDFITFLRTRKNRSPYKTNSRCFAEFPPRAHDDDNDYSRSFWISNSIVTSVSSEDLQAIAQHPDVLEIVENKILSVPPLNPESSDVSDSSVDLWNHRVIGVDKIKNTELDGSGVRVGHLDTGINPFHPDLEGKVINWAEFGPLGDKLESEPHETHDQSHGTHTASVIAGETTGIAPGVSLLSALVLPRGYGTIEQVLAGMQWVIDPDNDPATDDGAQIVNMSWGMSGKSEVLREAIINMTKAGILPVCAIGNYGMNSTLSPGNVPEAIGVGATNEIDRTAFFSGGGEVCWNDVCSNKPDITAPGVEISGLNVNGEYQKLTGTSLAAPHVAGTAALLLQSYPGLTLNQLRGFLLNTAIDFGPSGQDDRYGRGRLDAVSAFDFLDLYEPRFSTVDLVLETVENLNGSEIHKHHSCFFHGEDSSSGEEIKQTVIEPDMKTLGIADVNGDGHSDLVVSRTTQADTTESVTDYYVYPASDSKGFSDNPAKWYSHPGVIPGISEFLGFADVNGDGKSDLVFCTRKTIQPSQEQIQIHVLLSDAKNIFTQFPYPWATFFTRYPSKMLFLLGDVDGDRKTDLICEVRYSELFASSAWRPVSYLAGLSDGSRFRDCSYWLSVSPSPVSGPIESLAMSDVDGDGFDDLVLRDKGNGLTGRIRVYACRSNGKDRFYRNLVWAVFDPQEGMRIESVSDVNGDGTGDLIVNSSDIDSMFKVWLSDGRSVFFESQSPWFDISTLSMQCRDIHFSGAANVGLGNW